MAKLASKNSQIFVSVTNGDGGTQLGELKNVRDWTLNCDRNTIDVSTIGTEWKEFLVGQINASGSFNMLLDSDNPLSDTEIKKMLLSGNELKFHIRPEGSVAGKKEYNLTGLITSYNISAATEDAIAIAVNFQGTGELKEEVIAE